MFDFARRFFGKPSDMPEVAYHKAEAEMDRAQEIVARMSGPEDPLRPQLCTVLDSAIERAECALAALDAAKKGADAVLLKARCHVLLTDAFLLRFDCAKADQHAEKAATYLANLPMNEEILGLWATTIKYWSGAKVGMGDTRGGLAVLLAAREMIRNFPASTSVGHSIFDDQIARHRARFG
jgi:hypothetical protein